MKKYICAAAVLFSMCCSPFVTYAQKSPEEKLNMTMYAIMNMYVDTVDKVSFVDDVIARTMRSLDPFSAYLTPEEAMANEAALLGPTSFGGGEFAQQNQETGSQHFPVQMQKTVQTAYMADDRTGYIRLTMFAEQTLDEFREAVAALGKQGMKNLILDLQGNPGGFFESAVAVADEFLDGDKTIVTTSGAHVPTQTATCQTDGCFETGRVVLLVNGQTMSAAEILTGAMQDSGIATVIGETTYGKAVIQEMYTLRDGNAFKITTGRYITRNGREINHKGLEPDVYVVNTAEEIDVSKYDEIDYSVETRFGDKSENILPIKERLYVMGYYLSNMEDVFDAELEAAVLDFQITKGLTPTGALDRITMVQIENEFARTEVMVDNQLYEAYETFGGNKEDLIKFLEGEE